MNFFAGEIALGTLSDLWNSLDFSAMLSALMRLIAVFLCLTVHETCHGLAAYVLGDPTAKREHRLSLNPLHHIDWVGLACMLVLGFGWAKPVPVDMRNFKHPKRDMALTAAAGPVSNVLLAYLAVLLRGLCSLFWHTSITGMVVLLVLTYALEIVVDNVCARMTWGWMLKHAFGITLGLAIFNILWLYVR